MFSVRLFLAVAGVLLMSDACQAKAAVRQSRSTAQAISHFIDASDANEKALALLPKLPFRYEVYKRARINSLLKARKDLSKLLKSETNDRLATSKSALFWELAAQFAEESFNERTEECNQTSTYMQQTIAYTIKAIMEEPTAAEKKSEIEGLTKAFINEDGTIKAGVSEENIYDMGWNVTEVLGGYPFH